MEDTSAERENLFKDQIEPSQQNDQEVALEMKDLDSSENTPAADLTYIEDQSVKISAYLRKNEKMEFWSTSKIYGVINFYITNPNACIKNLFSILMFDWYELNKNSPESYFLIKKFGFFEDSGNEIYEKLFQKILNVFDEDEHQEYHEYCLNIIYFLFSEVKSVIQDDHFDKQLKATFRGQVIPKLIEMAVKVINANYRTQIVKLVAAFLNSSDEANYTELKQKILKSIQQEPSRHQSACKTSYNEIVKHCDELYFKLLFLLNENLLMSFKFEYKEFKKVYQNYFGEFWKHSIKLNAQLLYTFANLQNLVDSKEFLLIITDGVNLKSSITSTINKVGEFQAVFLEPLDETHQGLLDQMTNILTEIDDKYFMHSFKSLYRNTPKIRKLFFGRKDFSSLSLFEEILIIKEKLSKDKPEYFFDEILQFIWNEFKLWEKPEILTLKNPRQKRFFDYVLETRNDFQITSFLMPKIDDQYEEICKPLYFMMLKNSLFYDHNSVDLIEYHLNLIDKNERMDYRNTENLLYLLEEIFQFCPNQVGKNEFLVKLFKKILSEEADMFDGVHEPKLPRKHFWIGLMMIYWGYYVEFLDLGTTSKDIGIHKCNIILHSTSNPNEDILKFEGTFIPYLRLLSLIINNKNDNFDNEFQKNIKEMEHSYKDIYKLSTTYDKKHQETDENEIFNFYEKYSTNFCFILLYAAIKTDQKNIVKLIFDYNNFLISCPAFPANMIAGDIHYYTIQMFLENKYELGRGELPKNWIPHDVMEDFLDSRITCHDSFYKINCQFMLPYYNHDEETETIDDGVMMNEDYVTMEYILNDFELKSLVTHPVMEMIIRTKIEKYNRLFFWNLTIFILTYIGPTIFLVFLLHSYDNSNKEPEYEANILNDTSDDLIKNLTSNLNETYSKSSLTWFEDIIYHMDEGFRFKLLIILSLFRIFPIGVREAIQYRFIHKNDYFKKLSNLIEFGLIVLPPFCSFFSGLYWYSKNDTLFVILVVIEAINVLLMIIATAFLYPVLRFAIYMKCFLTVFTTYLTIFLLFLPLFFGCVAMAFIIFDKKLGGKIEEFHGFGNASTKYIVMYAGELNIDSDKLSGFIQVAAITIIIILIINKVNLIISIVVNDVQKVMDQAKEFSLRLYAKKYVEFAKKIRVFYASKFDQFCDDKNVTKFEKFVFSWIKLVIRKYPNIHQIRTLYVEKKTGYVFMSSRRPLFEVNYRHMRYLRKSKNWFAKAVVKFWDDMFSHLKIETETMNEIKKIIRRRNKIDNNLKESHKDGSSVTDEKEDDQ